MAQLKFLRNLNTHLFRCSRSQFVFVVLRAQSDWVSTKIEAIPIDRTTDRSKCHRSTAFFLSSSRLINNCLFDSTVCGRCFSPFRSPFEAVCDSFCASEIPLNANKSKKIAHGFGIGWRSSHIKIFYLVIFPGSRFCLSRRSFVRPFAAVHCRDVKSFGVWLRSYWNSRQKYSPQPAAAAHLLASLARLTFSVRCVEMLV